MESNGKRISIGCMSGATKSVTEKIAALPALRGWEGIIESEERTPLFFADYFLA